MNIFEEIRKQYFRKLWGPETYKDGTRSYFIAGWEQNNVYYTCIKWQTGARIYVFEICDKSPKYHHSGLCPWNYQLKNKKYLTHLRNYNVLFDTKDIV